MKHTPESIWICHSKECEGMWTENSESENSDCPNIDCSGKRVLYIRANLNSLRKSHDELLEAAKQMLEISELDPVLVEHGCYKKGSVEAFNNLKNAVKKAEEK